MDTNIFDILDTLDIPIDDTDIDNDIDIDYDIDYDKWILEV